MFHTHVLPPQNLISCNREAVCDNPTQGGYKDGDEQRNNVQFLGHLKSFKLSSPVSHYRLPLSCCVS